MCNKRNVEIRVEMYQNVQKVSRKRVFGCQRRFECLRVVGRVDGTIPLTHRTFGVILLRHDAFQPLFFTEKCVNFGNGETSPNCDSE